MKTAFVTGGAGFLGLNLLEILMESNWRITVFDLAPLPGAFAGYQYLTQVPGDITNSASCEDAMPNETDAVFHLAGDTNHWQLANQRQTEINVIGTCNLVNASLAKRAGRFIYTSSISAFGFQPGGRQITEDTESTAEGYWINYFHTKRLAELEVRKGIENGLDAVILNPANIIGPYDFSGFSRFFPMIKNNKLAGVPPGSATFCDVREVAKAHLSAFERGRKSHSYLLGGADATWLEFVNEIGRLLGKKTPAKATPAFVLKLLGRISFWVSMLTRRDPDVTPEKALLVSSDLICSSAKAIGELNYQPVALSKMLQDCYQWLMKENRL